MRLTTSCNTHNTAADQSLRPCLLGHAETKQFRFDPHGVSHLAERSAELRHSGLLCARRGHVAVPAHLRGHDLPSGKPEMVAYAEFVIVLDVHLSATLPGRLLGTSALGY